MNSVRVNYISIGQFGTFNHIYQIVQRLLYMNISVAYFGIAEGFKVRALPGLKVFEVGGESSSSYKLGPLRARLSLLKLLLSKRHLISDSGSVNIVTYFPGCSILLLLSRNSVLDVRTLSVHPKWYVRFLFDFLLKFESCLFSNITVLSKGMQSKFLYKKNITIVPLGGPKFDFHEKLNNKMSVLYVGTLKGRSILSTVEAFHKFVVQNPERPASYDIVARGDTHQERLILKYINQHALHDYVTFHGEVNFPEVTAYYLGANVGLSYIPITPYYDEQPPTKTFEYLLAGMYVIATATSENRRVINSANGCLIGDGVNDIVKAFQSTAIAMPNINNIEIYKNSEMYSWEAIVENNLLPLLNCVNKKL
jgi:glycosyltransferase involved in cell wall biosynthesis